MPSGPTNRPVLEAYTDKFLVPEPHPGGMAMLKALLRKAAERDVTGLWSVHTARTPKLFGRRAVTCPVALWSSACKPWYKLLSPAGKVVGLGAAKLLTRPGAMSNEKGRFFMRTEASLPRAVAWCTELTASILGAKPVLLEDALFSTKQDCLLLRCGTRLWIWPTVPTLAMEIKVERDWGGAPFQDGLS